MGKLIVFNFISLNGYFKGANGDISWHSHGTEENEFGVENLKSNATLLFGRITYQMMQSHWSTPQAKENDPVMAEGMNKADKIVFSGTLQKADWNNTRVIKENIIEEIQNMKQAGKNMAVLGSGSIVTQFAEQGLIDEYQLMIDPVVLVDGTPVFKNIQHQLNLKLIGTRAFKSGVVLLRYQPA